VPVGPEALVLDIGSGDKPHWRADVLVDRFPEPEHLIQRAGGAAARTPRALFDADAGDLPFADKAFDYVICSHVLEHVLDPAAAMREMIRVAKAGYIEVPHVGSAKLLDFPSHLWWVREVDGRLCFEAKTSTVFDADLHEWATTEPLASDLQLLLEQHLTSRLICFPWQDSFEFEVTGQPSEELLAAVDAAGAGHHLADSALVRGVTRVLTARQRRAADRPIRASEILKPELIPPGDPVLEARRYTVG
jgi:SAM-dependent methyltransferase